MIERNDALGRIAKWTWSSQRVVIPTLVVAYVIQEHARLDPGMGLLLCMVAILLGKSTRDLK